MSTVINTNVASLYAQNNLSGAQTSLANSVMRLSSGLRINSARDDAAGLNIAQNMQGQILSVNQSVKNLNDATNLVQVADSSMSTIQDMLLRIKQLATQGYDGSLSGAQKVNIFQEIQQLNSEINNTATRTRFNGNTLIANTIGISGGTAVTGLSLTNSTLTSLSANGAKAQTYTFSNVTGSANITLTGDDNVSQTLTISGTANNGSYTLNFDQLGISLNYVTGTGATAAGIATALGGNTGGVGKTVVVTGTSPAALTFQGGADTGTQNIITYTAINIKTDGSAGDFLAMRTLGTQIASTMNAYDANTATATWASAFQTMGSNVDAALEETNKQRGVMGALQNRISYISQNLQTYSTNLQSSRSAIIDTDFAAETAKLTKGQIMQQAATAMLAQANQMPNVVLSLLK